MNSLIDVISSLNKLRKYAIELNSFKWLYNFKQIDNLASDLENYKNYLQHQIKKIEENVKFYIENKNRFEKLNYNDNSEEADYLRKMMIKKELDDSKIDLVLQGLDQIEKAQEILYKAKEEEDNLRIIMDNLPPSIIEEIKNDYIRLYFVFPIQYSTAYIEEKIYYFDEKEKKEKSKQSAIYLLENYYLKELDREDIKNDDIEVLRNQVIQLSDLLKKETQKIQNEIVEVKDEIKKSGKQDLYRFIFEQLLSFLK